MVKSYLTRREQVSFLLLKGMSETKISQELGVSRQTIVRDVAFLKKLSQNWLDGLANDGFVFEYKMSLEKIRLDGKRLYELYDKVQDDRLKLDILRELDRNEKLYLELLGETPTIHAFRRTMQIKPQGNVSQS